LREQTLVIFTSDNGPAITGYHPHGSAGPLREKKGHLYEGGIRVPGIVRWPGRVEPGSVSDEPVGGVDFLPTACALAGVAPPADRALDGVNLLPLLDGRPLRRRRPLYWHFNSASSEPKVAMRQGDWKILAHLDTPPRRRTADILDEVQHAIKTAELTRFELYHLRDDIGEQHDLASRETERLETMSRTLRELYHEVREESPRWPAWQWPRYEGKRIEWPSYMKQRSK
jgi:arylsulfatase A